jgi:nucleoside-diphosphate-sugar epimerase
MSERRVCAVTGASGYVGSRLAAGLAEEFEILTLGRGAAAGMRWSFEETSPLAEELRARKVKVLVHAAWDFRHPKAADNWRVNVEGSKRLLEAAREAGVEQVVFVSTISAFAGARSDYGRAKLAVEAMVLAMGGTVVRPGLVWGERPGGMFGSLRQQVSKGGFVPVIGQGRYPQYLVHEDDLAAAVRRSAMGEFRGRVLTVAHSQGWLLRDLILRMAAEQRKKVTLVGVPWRLIFAALKTAETAGLKPGFRSDSVVSLVYQDAAPEFAQDVPVRAFV